VQPMTTISDDPTSSPSIRMTWGTCRPTGRMDSMFCVLTCFRSNWTTVPESSWGTGCASSSCTPCRTSPSSRRELDAPPLVPTLCPSSTAGTLGARGGVPARVLAVEHRPVTAQDGHLRLRDHQSGSVRDAARKCAVVIIIPYFNLLEHTTTGSAHSVYHAMLLAACRNLIGSKIFTHIIWSTKVHLFSRLLLA
jgi:hypothetical protein